MNKELSLLFAGDIMLGENLYHIKRGIRTKYQNSYEYFIPENISKILFDDVDVFIYNFEYSLVPITTIFQILKVPFMLLLLIV